MKLPPIVCVINRHGTIVEASAGASRWRDVAGTEVVGATPHVLLHSQCSASSCLLNHRWRELWLGMRTSRLQSCEVTDPLLSRRLRLRAERIHRSPGDGNGERFGILRIDDMGSGQRGPSPQDRRLLHAERPASDRDIARAVECERRRIAADLHDGVSQQLALLKLQIESRLACGFSTDPASSAEDFLLQVVDGIKGTLRDIRKLNGSLMTDRQHPCALVTELRLLCDNADRVQPGTRVTFESPLEDADFTPARCGEDLPRAIYCIAQEAVSNALRHAAARTIRVRLFPFGEPAGLGELTLSIQDDGCGLASDRPRPAGAAGNGFGLTTMRQRAQDTGGELVLCHAAEGGTEIRSNWPMVLRTV